MKGSQPQGPRQQPWDGAHPSYGAPGRDQQDVVHRNSRVHEGSDGDRSPERGYQPPPLTFSPNQNLLGGAAQ